MPRLIPRSKPEERLVRATRNVPWSGNSNYAEFRIRRGEFAPATDHRVKSDPDAWEELPPLEERSSTPGASESVAIAAAHFVVDGRMIERGKRFWPDDPLVRRFPGAFYIQLP